MQATNKPFKALTEKQANMLRFVIKYKTKHGYFPTIREIGDAFGISSTNGVFDHLNALVRKGYLERHFFQARSMRILRNANGTPFVDPYRLAVERFLDYLESKGVTPPMKARINKLRKFAA